MCKNGRPNVNTFLTVSITLTNFASYTDAIATTDRQIMCFVFEDTARWMLSLASIHTLTHKARNYYKQFDVNMVTLIAKHTGKMRFEQQ